MKVHELINVLKSRDPELEVFACSDDDLWVISLPTFREASLYTTKGGDVVESDDYEPEKDGEILSQHNVLLLDLDL